MDEARVAHACRWKLFYEAGDGWRMDQDGHSMIRRRSMKTLISVLSRVGWVKLPDWGSVMFPIWADQYHDTEALDVIS